MTTKVVLYESIPEGMRVIEAFPSNGFVSTIAAQRIIDGLDMKVVGHIESDKIQGIVVIHNSVPLKPIRVYAKDDLCVIYSEVMIPLEYVNEFSKALIDWFNRLKPKEVFVLAGISGAEVSGEHEILGIAITDEMSKRLKKANVNIIENGMVTGISAELLMHCSGEGIPCVSLVTETHFVPDPMAAASMIKILNSLLSVKVTTDELVAVGKEIESQVKDISEQIKRGKEKYKQMECLTPMYG
ncbi:MAG: PAC2 family protein [Methanobacteriota archaeon]